MAVRGKNGKLNRVFRAFALGAGDARVPVQHNALVALATIVTNILVDGHQASIR